MNRFEYRESSIETILQHQEVVSLTQYPLLNTYSAFPDICSMLVADDIKTGVALPLMEHFYTIQGEGYHQGRAAYFIRLAGCDVGCVWCDVKESWHTDGYPVVPVQDMASLAANAGSPIAVVTGGEPLMYQLDALTDAIRQKEIKTHIETSAAYPLSGTWDWICISPKKFKAALPENLPHANELKIIVYNKSDFKWAEEYAAQVNSACKLYLQPEWSVESKMLPLIIEYVKANPKWEVSLQIHKYMQIP